MRYFFAHALTAILLSAVWLTFLAVGANIIAGLFESRDVGIIMCFVFGVIFGGPIVGTYYLAHSRVDEWVFDYEIKKGK